MNFPPTDVEVPPIDVFTPPLDVFAPPITSFFHLVDSPCEEGEQGNELSAFPLPGTTNHTHNHNYDTINHNQPDTINHNRYNQP